MTTVSATVHVFTLPHSYWCTTQPPHNTLLPTSIHQTSAKEVPYTRGLSYTPGPTFHGRCLHGWNNSVGAIKCPCWKHLAKSFPKTSRSVLAPSWLSGNRARKNAPAGGDGVIHSTVVYGTASKHQPSQPGLLIQRGRRCVHVCNPGKRLTRIQQSWCYADTSTILLLLHALRKRFVIKHFTPRADVSPSTSSGSPPAAGRGCAGSA